MPFVSGNRVRAFRLLFALKYSSNKNINSQNLTQKVLLSFQPKISLKANLHTRKMSRRKAEIHSTFRCSGNFRFSTSIIPFV